MICETCRTNKDACEFYFRKDTNKHRASCKECVKRSRKTYREQNGEKVKESKKKYYDANKEACCQRSVQWYVSNKDVKNKKHAIYMKNRRNNDANFKLYSLVTTRIYIALKGYMSSKNSSTSEIIGCSIAFYRRWIEHQFTPEMNWDNHGEYWHIDHVRPCASFNLADNKEFKSCFNWRNVRPVQKRINLSKNDKIDEDLIAAHSLYADSFATKVLNENTGSDSN